jgi:tRNA-2-methylthio-N6-dimethylallyladenosine synthase
VRRPSRSSAARSVASLREAGRRHGAIVVAGCVAQQEGERLLTADAPFIDLVVGPDNIPELPRLRARDRGRRAAGRAHRASTLDDPRFLVAQRRGPSALEVTAFVTTMKGCDERCSFCIVPYTRGPERYRTRDDIVRRSRTSSAAGAREVTLLGQTVNSYRPAGPRRARGPRPGRARSSPSLLRRIADEVPGLCGLRYTSPAPASPDARRSGRAHAELPVLAAHVHLPVQSGSDRCSSA